MKKKIRHDFLRKYDEFVERGADVEEDDFDDEEDVDLVTDDKVLPLNNKTDEDIENEMENTRKEERKLQSNKLKNSNKEWLSELHRGSPR